MTEKIYTEDEIEALVERELSQLDAKLLTGDQRLRELDQRDDQRLRELDQRLRELDQRVSALYGSY